MQRSQVARRQDDDGGFGKDKAPTGEAAERIESSRFDLQNRKRDARQRHIAVKPAQQRRSAEGRSQLAGAVDHAANHAGIGMIGDGDAVIREKSHTHRAAFDGNVVNVEAAIAVDGRGELAQVRGNAGGVEFADENFGEARLGGGSGGAIAPSLRIVNGEGSLIEVALELKAGFIHELLVLRRARDRGQLGRRIEGADPLEIDVKKAVCAGKKPCGLGRRVFAQCDKKGDGSRNQHHGDEDGNAASNAHRRLAGAASSYASEEFGYDSTAGGG